MFGCLLLPNFRLQAALRWREHTGSAVVASEASSQALLCEVNAAAARCGITPGMTPPQAMARDGRVLILPRSLPQEDCLNQLLIELGLSLSPWAELTRDGACIVDLRQTARQICWQQLGDDLHARGQGHGVELLIGLSATPDLADLAAQSAKPVSIVYDPAKFVAGLPLTALEPSPALLAILEDWGLRGADDFLALPAAEAGERLGPEAQDLRRKLSGRHLRPLRLVRSRARYAEAFDFEHEVETAEPLLFLLRRFLEALSARLRGAYRVAKTLRLTIPLENKEVYERTFAIPAPTAEVDVLFRILQAHLETLQLEQRPTGVQLEIEPAAQGRDQLQLFESALRDPNQFGETLGRLKALLGNDRVGVPHHCDTHQPGRFQLADGFSPERKIVSEAMLGLPLRRFRPPLRSSVEVEDGVPVRLAAAGIEGAILHLLGPFLLSGHWWDEDRWRTEEWDVALEEGDLYRLSRQGHDWQVEGCYEVR